MIGVKSLTGSNLRSGYSVGLMACVPVWPIINRYPSGARILDGQGGGIAGATGPIIDDDRLSDAFGDLLAEEAHHDIRAAAGRKRNDDRDRMRRVVVGLGD